MHRIKKIMADKTLCWTKFCSFTLDHGKKETLETGLFNNYNGLNVSIDSVNTIKAKIRRLNDQVIAHFAIVKFFIGFDTLLWLIFIDFQNEATGLCVNNSINKDVK